MKFRRLRSIPLFWKIFGLTSLTTTLLFGAIALIVNTYLLRETKQSVTEEAQASLSLYESLWRAKAESLGKLSLLMSKMSDVRAAVATRDAATVRDTAGELWRSLSQGDAVFLVFDTAGDEISSLGGQFPPPHLLGKVIVAASTRFPNQVAGFVSLEDRLYYLLLTPVYVQTETGQALLNVLAAGFPVDNRLAAELKNATKGSDFLFRAGDKTVASTLAQNAASPAGEEYAAVVTPLRTIDGNRIGELRVMRSLQKSTERLRWLSRMIGLVWVVTLAAGLLMTYFVAARLVEPVRALDRAASEIGRGNYAYRVPIRQDDELGRLGRTFNAMCDSIEKARDELISQERLNTVGRLSSSIVHDLRNPLAAVYAGAEMLVDSADLSHDLTRRLAMNIYRASQRIQQLLEDLSQSVKHSAQRTELCRLKDLVESAYDMVSLGITAPGVRVDMDVPQDLEVVVHRSRMERVFLNLMSNSLEAMPNGGILQIQARSEEGSVIVQIDDSGIGLSDEVRKKVFQPFFSSGKRSGLGLGLALSRQTVVDHGGNLWAAHKGEAGARFCLQLPLTPSEISQQKVPEDVNL